MTPVKGSSILLVMTLVTGRLSGQDSPLVSPALSDAAAVMQKVVERAQTQAKDNYTPKYRYEKHTRIEELDASGKATSTKEEIYEVFPIEGVPYSRLVRIGNRELTAKESKEQDRKEQEFRKSLANEAQGQSEKTNQSGLDPALVARFTFQIQGRETNDSRSALVLSFEPKSKRGAEKEIADRVLNRLAGTIWVDEADWEISRLKVHLTDELSLGWFGMVGSLKELSFELEEKRMPDGVWVPKKQTLSLRGRKVLSPMRYRTMDDCSNFRRNPD